MTMPEFELPHTVCRTCNRPGHADARNPRCLARQGTRQGARKARPLARPPAPDKRPARRALLRRAAEAMAVARQLGVDLEALSVDHVERSHVLYVVRVCKGNMSLAARVLGLYRRTLQRKLAGWRRRGSARLT
jgi:ActR/RegA family two-component response regulator